MFDANVLFTLLLVASAAASRHILYERAGFPEGWVRINDPASTELMKFSVALPQQNLGLLSKTLEEVSDPLGPKYGQYMSEQDIQAMTATKPETKQEVLSFLRGAACREMSDSLKCASTVGEVEKLFETKVAKFHHKVSGTVRLAHIGSLSVPSNLASSIDFVSGLSHFFTRKEKREVRQPLRDDPIVVPSTLRAQYNISVTGSSAYTQGVGEFGLAECKWSPGELADFGKNVNLSIALEHTAGDPCEIDEADATETALDLEYIAAVGIGNTNWLWYENTWLFELTQSLMNSTDEKPSVISLSYGWNEEDQCRFAQCQKLGVNATGYVLRVNTEFQKIGVSGITLTASSGDSGSHGRTDETCLLNPKTHPAYPAASPFITAVGGTQLLDATSGPTGEPICDTHFTCATSGREVVASHETHSPITSGGGFSNVASRPAYQDAAVSAYLKNSSAVPPSKDFNAAGRGYPDISALSHNYYVQINSTEGVVDGTSASSPVVAGIFGLINAQRIAAGKPPLGFVNPTLYQIFNMTNGEAFNDVVQGDNRCTESGCLCRNGFKATPGWDAATGLGTPNVAKILAALDTMDKLREAKYGK